MRVDQYKTESLWVRLVVRVYIVLFLVGCAAGQMPPALNRVFTEPTRHPSDNSGIVSTLNPQSGQMSVIVLSGQFDTPFPICLRHMHVGVDPDDYHKFTFALEDDITGNRLTIGKNPELYMYCIDKHKVAHAKLIDCSEMTNGFCNGQLWANGVNFGDRKEESCGCKWRK